MSVSRYRQGMLEGVVIRRENTDVCLARAKLVRPDFTQAITEHVHALAVAPRREKMQ